MKKLRVIMAVIGMITGVALVDGEPTVKEIFGGSVLVVVVITDLLVTAYENEFKTRKEANEEES